MAARGLAVRIAAGSAVLVGGLFAASVLPAAIRRHPAAGTAAGDPGISRAQELPDREQEPKPTDQRNMPGTDSSCERANEAHAVHDRTPGPMDAHNAHMHVTATRKATPGDTARAREIVTQLRSGIAKYRDYHVALGEGYKIFLANVPRPEYHFTNYSNAFLEAFTFEPSRPTSLLYKKTAAGYELVGAMYTMPKRATEEQLNERVPLSVASWHLHTNLCLPPHNDIAKVDTAKFGLQGSISTPGACEAAGGRFRPVVFGWMVHVYPYANGLEDIFAMHMD